jgi:glycerol-3-phosphate dehydrogenase
MAQKLRDFFARRTRWEILDWNSCLEAIKTVADLMAQELSWSEERKTIEGNTYEKLLVDFKTVASNEI